MKNVKEKMRGIIVNIEVLKLRKFSKEPSSNEIDIAFPVLAYECEASIPVEKEVDVYEEAILQFISIGLTKNIIRSTLKITQSLCGSIFANLEGRGYIEKKNENNYKLTPKAINFLNGVEITTHENESKFGYIFVSAIKKEPLWYFYEDDVLNIPRSDSYVLENKLTKEKNDAKTFEYMDIKQWRIEKAISTYCRIIRALEKKGKGNISDEEVVELFADIESDLIEADYQGNNEEEGLNTDTHKLTFTTEKVRKLKSEPKKIFLQIRIIFDPAVPGGFMVESPFDFNGYDNDFFLRQIQWMRNPTHNVYRGEDKFSQFISNELNKLQIDRKNDVDSGVFIMNKLPILHTEKDRYTKIYEDTLEIVDMMNQKNLSPLKKENIVGSFTRKFIERLMNRLFKTVPYEDRKKIRKRALNEFKTNQNKMVEHFAEIIKVDREDMPKTNIISYAIEENLGNTFGHSIYKKLINLIVFRYYQPSPEIKRFFQIEGIADYIKIVEKLNTIRNSASHDPSKKPLTNADYEYYIEHIFDVANRLLEALQKEEI